VSSSQTKEDLLNELVALTSTQRDVALAALREASPNRVRIFELLTVIDVRDQTIVNMEIAYVRLQEELDVCLAALAAYES
jgi:hypothetical protein